MIRYGSVCSGVEAATLAWKPLGWECVFVSEVEPFPCAVLQHRFGATRPIHPLDPAAAVDDADATERRSWMKQNEKLREDGVIPNEGDFTKIGDKYRGKIDLLVGGTPCQDLSVAGQRAGFEGERSVLAIDFVRLAYESNCRWFCWENVPGVFSSNGGGDFARLLSLFTGCEVGVPEQGFGSAGFVCNARRDRFGVAWRVLDAQFTRVPGCFPFAIPQRRRRVFVVGYLGDWRRAASVLLEPGSVSWTTPARRKTRKAVAGSFGSGIKTPGGVLNGSHWDDFLANPHPTLCAYKTGIGASNQEVFVQRGAMLVPVLDSVYTVRMRSGCDGGGKGALVGTEMSHTLATSNDQTVIYTIDADRSNAMKSSNPNSGIHEADVAKTLDTTVPTPQKAQGGQMVVQFAAGFVGRQGAEAGSIGYEAEVCPTIRYSMNPDVVISLAAGQGGEWGCLGVDVAQTLSLNNGGFHYIACYENHANDSRVTFSGSVSPSLTSRAGTGGGNLPLVMSSTDFCFDVGNGQVDCSMHPLYECATTLHCMHDANAVMCVPINSMIIGKDVTLTDRQTIGIGQDGDALPTLQANHHHAVAVVASFMGGQGSAAGGIGYRKELSPTIKASPSGGNTVPDVMVAACAIAENVIGRQIHNGGNGVGAKLEVAYTIDTVGVQGVAVDVVDKQGMALRDVVPTLTATSFKEAPSINAFGYVRRLLPVECERLMGFPDNHTRIPWNGRSELECPDGPRYKACGNSFCVNVVRWIGEQIQRVDNMEDADDAESRK